ncbi:MAG: GNAT family N-acetyltransferase [Rhodospirillales bacterium]
MAATRAAPAAAPQGPPKGLIERAIPPQAAAALVALSAEAGWNQVAADWRFMLEAGEGRGFADAEGRWIATALTVGLGARLAWISMVLTAGPWRHRGLGARLLKGAIARVRAAGAVAGLDATEQGRPIYRRLGFRELYRLRRWRLGRALSSAPPPEGTDIRAMAPGDLDTLAALDRRLSGFERRHVLEHLLGRAPALAHVAARSGEPVGFVLGRDGRFAAQIGPVVARDEASALALASRAAASMPPPFVLDVPDRHAGTIAWIRSAGGEAPRRFWRMALGRAPELGDEAHVFALAGPELA